MSHLQATTVSIPQELPSDLVRFIFLLHMSCQCWGDQEKKSHRGSEEGFEMALFLFTALQLSPGSFGSLSWWGCQRPHSRIFFLGCHLLALWGVTSNLLVFEGLFYLIAMCWLMCPYEGMHMCPGRPEDGLGAPEARAMAVMNCPS